MITRQRKVHGNKVEICLNLYISIKIDMSKGIKVKMKRNNICATIVNLKIDIKKVNYHITNQIHQG